MMTDGIIAHQRPYAEGVPALRLEHGMRASYVRIPTQDPRASRAQQQTSAPVRLPAEYAAGHIPGSVNVPLSEIGRIQQQVPARETPLYVYCTVGMRAQMAVEQLVSAGYESVANIGGIMDYAGDLER